MTRTVSIGARIKQLEGLLGTRDLNAWEQGFVSNLVETTRSGAETRTLSDAQLGKIEKIWGRHFA